MKKNNSWNIRRLVDKSFVPSSQQTSLLFCRLTFSDETIQEIVGIFETNSIEIRLQQSEVNGLYEIGSMMEHSCCPNVRMSFDDKFNVSSSKVEIVYKERQVTFLSSSKNSENLNFSTVHQQQQNSDFQNFCWMIRTQPISLLKLFLL